MKKISNVQSDKLEQKTEALKLEFKDLTKEQKELLLYRKIVEIRKNINLKKTIIKT